MNKRALALDNKLKKDLLDKNERMKQELTHDY